MATYTCKNEDATLIFTVSGVPIGQKVRFYARDSSGNEIIEGNDQYHFSTSKSSFTVEYTDVLEENTTYVCNVGYPADPVSWLGSKTLKVGSFGTEEEEFTGDIQTDSTTNSIRARLRNLNTNYPTDHEMRFRMYVDGSRVVSFYFYMNGSSSTSWQEKTGLTPNTEYTVRIRIDDTETGWYNSWSETVWTLKPAVEKWNWNKSNGSATSAQTTAALNALTGRGPTSNFSYKVWNDLCNKVSELRLAKELSAWDSDYYGSLDDTTMSNSGQILTAKKFNALRNNLNAVENCNVSVVSKGDIVKAVYFTNITNAINKGIDNL